MQLVIIAGGKGTRLKQANALVPKPMVEIGGKPLLEHQILLARKHGIRDVLILTSFGAEYIEQYFGDGSRWDVNIRYHRDPEPRGTAGAFLNAFEKLEPTFLVMYGDTMLNVDLTRFASAHHPGSAATLFLHPNNHPQDSDLVEVDEANRVVRFHPYPHSTDACLANLVNAALYVVDRDSLLPWRNGRSYVAPLDFAKHVFPALIADGAAIYGYRSREYIKDIGTPARLERVRSEFDMGRVGGGALDTPVPAVFLDRDGTLNHDTGWLKSPDQLRLLDGAADAVRGINEAGRLAVLITNQPVIARGECTEDGLAAIHNKLEWLLGQSHAFLDRIYYCPHHPDSGFPGERAELKIACACRKPNTGLLQLAAQELNVDVQRSWMIGDRAEDVLAARSFGVRSVLVHSGRVRFQNRDCKPDAETSDVREAVGLILNEA